MQSITWSERNCRIERGSDDGNVIVFLGGCETLDVVQVSKSADARKGPLHNSQQDGRYVK